MRYWDRRKAELRANDGGLWKDAQQSLKKARFHWWQWRYRRATWAQIRHWWIFKIGNLHPFKQKGAESYPPAPFDFPGDLGSRNEIERDHKKEWISTLLPGDSFEGIARISVERKAKGLCDGAAADGK